MAQNEIHVGDVGTTFTVTILDENSDVVNLSTADVNLLFEKPDGVVLTKDASFVTDGTDGQVKYVTIAGDLDLHGNWSLQAFVDYGSVEWYSDIAKFKVHKNVGC